MADLIQCPKCGLRQSVRHAYCARCEYRFTGSPDESVFDDDPPTGTPTGSTATPATPTGSPLDVFAGLPDESLGGADSGSWGSVTPGKRDSGSWRRDNPPPRSESIRASRDGGRLLADRGSLGRRQSQNEEAPTEELDEDHSLPAAPSWNMPLRSTAPGARSPGPRSTPGEPWPPPPSDVSNSGSIPGYLLRGRPQSELYASEHSVPPQDPLMADLVAGRVASEGLPVDDFAPLDAEPPIHPTFGDLPAPIDPDDAFETEEDVWDAEDPNADTARDDAPRVVAPRMGQRRYSQHRRRDPRGRPVASPAADEGLPADGPVSRDPIPAAPAVPGVAGEHDFVGMDDFPAAPPMPAPLPTAGVSRRSVPAAHPPHRARQTATQLVVHDAPRRLRRTPPGVGRVAALVVVGVLLVAAVNGAALFRARAALTRALDIGIGPNGPTPDLPVVLRQRIAELDLERNIEAFHAQIAGGTDSYRVGVHMETRVAGFPIGWSAVRAGSFKVDKRIRSLQIYVSAGWELDTEAMDRLTAYSAERQRRRGAAHEPDAPANDDDDSAAPPPAE